MTFKQATDRLGELGMTQVDIAAALGIAPSTVRACRLPARSPGRREPPAGWEARLAKAAAVRGGALGKLAKELERAARAD